ncbi:hypothetical protein GH714_004305 [Hevea brasiliensis]|uniref:BZIP domain-containing protein n=1 Tax=Hevea brasiliensis TaxID=3981 RepID=A0A6A6MCE5_HEVBR|nr:hypothetical protein GH714_004305 [Hevea brasiliensis]
MGMQTMGSQCDGSSDGKQTQFQPLARQNSMYGLTLDEVQDHLGDLGKPLSSMNLDELLKNVWTVEANQSMGIEVEGTQLANQTALQRQASLSLTSALSKKTVDEVWRDIQQSKNNGEKKSRERQPTLGEMTLEDFLVKAGVVAEASLEKRMYQHPQQNMMGVYMPAQPMPQPLHVGAGAVMDVSYPENQVPLPLPSPLMGTLSDVQTLTRKRGTPEDMMEKTVERRQKRMIKNRESAARSRARKQAYTNELENKVSRLQEENERLRKRKELEKMLPCVPIPEPKYQLRRTTSAPF